MAVKCQGAYSRKLDFDQVPPEKAAPVFRKVVGKEPVSSQDMKLLEDHLFWYAVEQATLHGLPVKVHTGYLTGENFMPLGHVAGNPVEAAEMCRKSPHTQFVFMHIAYPYWQPMIAVAKHYSDATHRPMLGMDSGPPGRQAVPQEFARGGPREQDPHVRRRLFARGVRAGPRPDCPPRHRAGP